MQGGGWRGRKIRILSSCTVLNVIIDDIHDCRTGGLTGELEKGVTESESQRVRESESEHAHHVTERYTGGVLGVVQKEERDTNILQEHTSPRVGKKKTLKLLVCRC